MKATAFNPYDKAWMFGFPNQAWATQANYDNNNKGVTAVNIAEGVDSFDLEVALPGFEKEQINVSFDKLLLTISAEKPAATQETKPNYRRQEFAIVNFKRSFELPKNVVDTQNIAARYENGILYVALPKLKPAEVEPVKVSISVH